MIILFNPRFPESSFKDDSQNSCIIRETGCISLLVSLRQNWAEPTFMTITYIRSWANPQSIFAGLSSFFLIGNGSDMLLRYENVAQTVTYLLAFIGLIGLLRLLIKEKFIGDDAAQVFTRVLLCASFIGSFLCYLFWGSKKYLHFAFFPAAYSDGGIWRPADDWFCRQ